MANKVCLSPSSQSDNAYAYGNTTEAVQCGRIAGACKAALERNGVEVLVTHMDTLAEKCSKSDKFRANLHVPIHTNAYNGIVSGTRMFYSTAGSVGNSACNYIFASLSPVTPGKSENIKPNPSLYEIHVPKAPTAYIEVDFHDVPSVAKWIIENTETIGEAIAKGICEFFGIEFKRKEESATPDQPEQKTRYRVQIGSFAVRANAEALLSELHDKGYEAYITKVTL